MKILKSSNAVINYKGPQTNNFCDAILVRLTRMRIAFERGFIEILVKTIGGVTRTT